MSEARRRSRGKNSQRSPKRPERFNRGYRHELEREIESKLDAALARAEAAEADAKEGWHAASTNALELDEALTALEAAEAWEREARAMALEEAAKWHDAMAAELEVLVRSAYDRGDHNAAQYHESKAEDHTIAGEGLRALAASTPSTQPRPPGPGKAEG